MARDAIDTADKPAQKASGHNRLGPDPLGVLLPALGALGAIASIAALNWAERDTASPPPSRRRNAAQVLRNLERDCQDLQDAFRKLVRGVSGIVTGGGTTGLPMKFGVHSLDVTSASYPHYQTLMTNLSSLIGRTGQDSYELMGLIVDGIIEPPEELFFAFADQQERLNQLLGHPRPSLKTTIETAFDVTVKLTTLIEELSAYRRD